MRFSRYSNTLQKVTTVAADHLDSITMRMNPKTTNQSMNCPIGVIAVIPIYEYQGSIKSVAMILNADH